MLEEIEIGNFLWMEVSNLSTTVDVVPNLETVEEIGDSWRIGVFTAVKFATIVVSLLGLLGNFWSYKAADFMPKSNSSVLMKYLAVWDSLAVVHLGLATSLTDLFNLQTLHQIVSVKIARN